MGDLVCFHSPFNELWTRWDLNPGPPACEAEKTPKDKTENAAALAASKLAAAEALGLVHTKPFSTRKPGRPSAKQRWQKFIHDAIQILKLLKKVPTKKISHSGLTCTITNQNPKQTHICKARPSSQLLASGGRPCGTSNRMIMNVKQLGTTKTKKQHE
eukprot:4199488-Amphidinium_carterae.1